MFNSKFDFFSLKGKIRRKCHIKLIVTSLPKNTHTHTETFIQCLKFIDRSEREPSEDHENCFISI